MRMMLRFVGTVVVASLVVRVIVKRLGGFRGVGGAMTRVTPVVLGMMFRRIDPQRRQHLLTRCRAMLTGIEEQLSTDALDEDAYDDDGMDARFAA